MLCYHSAVLVVLKLLYCLDNFWFWFSHVCCCRSFSSQDIKCHEYLWLRGEYGECLIRVAVDEYAFMADIFHTL